MLAAAVITFVVTARVHARRFKVLAQPKGARNRPLLPTAVHHSKCF